METAHKTGEPIGEGPLETSEAEARPIDRATVEAIIRAHEPRTSFDGPVETLRAEIHELLDDEREQKLEADFMREHHFDLGEEEMEYTLVRGADTTAGHSPEWTVFVGGFSSIKDTYKEEMLDLARTGRNVLFVSPDHGASPSEEEAQYFSAQNDTIAETIERKAIAVKKLMEHLGIKNANIIGHSQGGAVSAVLADLRPSESTRLILDNPAGLVGAKETGELLRGVHREAKSELARHKHEQPPIPKQSRTSWWRQAKKLLRDPLWRATKEIPGIAHTDIRPILERLKRGREAGKGGPEIILINANDDQLFRKEEVEQALGEAPLSRYLDRWAMYAEKHAGHGKFDRVPGLYPQVLDAPPSEHAKSHVSVIHQLITGK